MIVSEGDRVDDVVPECGIAARILVFVLGHKQALTAASAGVHSGILDPPVLSSEWSLISDALSNVELDGTKFFLEFFFPFSEVLGDPSLVRIPIFEFSGASIFSLKHQMSHTAINRVH